MRCCLRLCVLALLALLAGAAYSAPTQKAPRPELRAFWADSFEVGYKTPQQVEELLQRLHTTHCNAIFAQVRRRGDAYYRSHYEPWAKDDPTHFDALACLIQKAHAMNPPIAVHAWINTCAVGGYARNPFQILHLHPDWLALNPQGSDFDGEASMIDPGVPGAEDWTFRVFLDVVRHYAVDGIHLDFVRYGGKEWGYNPVSVARFRRWQQRGRSENRRVTDGRLPSPDDPDWKQWRRDQVTNLVRKVYAHAVEIDPKIVVSAAVIAWGDGPHNDAEWFTKSAAMNRAQQDWRGWLEEGTLDLACPMTYFQADTHTEWQRHWSDFIKDHQYHRAATVGVGTWFNTIPQSLDLIKIARQKSAKGHWPYGVMLYSYAGTNAGEARDAQGKRAELTLQPAFYAALSRPSAQSPPFPTDAPLPPMPWKIRPKQGILKGFALTPNLQPMDGVIVTVRGHGKTYRRRADGTGFYAFLTLPPGDYRVWIEGMGPARQERRATVRAGQVTTVNFTPGSAPAPQIASLAALQNRLADSQSALNGTPVRLENLRVVLGTDTFPDNLYVMDAHGYGLRVRLETPPLLPFQPGDVVSIYGTPLPVEGEPTLDHAVACLTDMLPERALPAPRTVAAADLRAGTVPNGALARITGTVTEANPNALSLDCSGTSLRVSLTGLKDYEVESAGLNQPLPVVGAPLTVTGVVSFETASEGKTSWIHLRPIDPEAIQALPAPASFWQSHTALGVALCCFRSAADIVPA